jgi:hypothetical protein
MQPTYQRATLAPASAMASATAKPMPSAAPVTMTVLPVSLNCSKTLLGPGGVGRAVRGVASDSSSVTDMLTVRQRYWSL